MGGVLVSLDGERIVGSVLICTLRLGPASSKYLFFRCTGSLVAVNAPRAAFMLVLYEN